MSTFPHFSDFTEYVKTKLDNRKGKIMDVSNLNCWVRLVSGTGPGGLVLTSNPNFELFKAAGVGLYGNESQSGIVGVDWAKKPVTSAVGQGYRPSPVVTSLEIDEGAGNLSRKASFTITAFTKEQMESITQYFLEPGYSIFIEWGWNTVGGVKGLQTELNATEISKYQSFVQVNAQRKKGRGEYDNYLGFMTGGSVSIDNDKWTISVKASGYTELPAYLISSENASNNTGKLTEGITTNSYGVKQTENVGKSDIALQRWMRVFNELPENRQTTLVKALAPNVAKLENFINWDDDIIGDVNGYFDGVKLFGYAAWRNDQDVAGDEVTFPKDTAIVDVTNRYIRFGTLMDIFNAIGTKGYKIGGETGRIINFQIQTNDTLVSSFKNIVSLDASKLFIPNTNAPKLKLGGITDTTKLQDIIITADKKASDSSVNKTIKFPETKDLKKDTPTGAKVLRKAHTYGYLENLYINFEFAKGILQTENFFVKDALYQLLNGMSSAVNSMWDFQILETEVGKGLTARTILKVHEINNISNGSSTAEPYVFDLMGDKSIFIDSSLDLDISGMKMNQIIGQRLGRTINESGKRIPSGGQLFSQQKDLLEISLAGTTSESTGESGDETTSSAPERTPTANEKKHQANLDRAEANLQEALKIKDPDVKVTIDNKSKRKQQHINSFNGDKTNAERSLARAKSSAINAEGKAKKEDAENAKDDNLVAALGKLKCLPLVEFNTNNKPVKDKDLYDLCYIGAIEDPTIFTLLRHNFNIQEVEDNTVSPLMPINFTFTIHGVSGIKRGDMFKINGIPKQYALGFFQVISVKHTLDGMLWKTEITGGYRNK